MRALVTGATGFIGRKLLERLDRPIILSREPKRAGERLAGLPVGGIHAWDPLKEAAPAAALDGVDVIFHLAGESVGKGRWTKARKARIRESRVLGTRNLVAALENLPRRPRTLVSASAVGFYGSRGDETLDETAAAGDDFLAEVCVAWEQEAAAARRLGVRVVNPRFGIVLGKEGALAKMLTPFKWGVGGRLGSGRQWMPWIHVDDAIGLLLHGAGQGNIDGPLNAVSQQQVTNREFTQVLAQALHRPAFLPAPYLGLRVLLGEFATALVSSQRVVPRVAAETGYAFQYPDLADALKAILG